MSLMRLRSLEYAQLILSAPFSGCAKAKVKRLLCEGGGEINEALFRARLVNEVYLTLSPVIFGGRQAPTLADGEGVAGLSDSANLLLKSRKRLGQELFLVFGVTYPPNPERLKGLLHLPMEYDA